METQTKKLSLTSAILMNINLMVGASAFMAPTFMTKAAGDASFYGWLVAGLLFFPVVWCIAQITTYFPEQGSFYCCSSKTMSKTAGFFSGWIYFLGYISIGALQLMSLISILQQTFGFAFIKTWPGLFGSLLVLALGALSMRSLGVIDMIQSGATLYKLAPLLLGTCSLVYYFCPARTASIMELSPLTLIPTIPMAIFGFWGFEGVCSISHLIKDGAHNVRRAIFGGFFATVLIYTLFHLSLLAIMGAPALQTLGAIGFPSFLAAGSPLLAKILNAIVMSAIIIAHVNAIFGGIVANSAMLRAMAEERMVFWHGFFATKIASSDRPFGAVIAHCAGLIIGITVVAHVNVLNAMSNLGVLMAFFMTIIALMLRSKKIAAPLLGFASCLVLGYYSWQVIGADTGERLIALLPMIGAVLGGYLLYYCKAECVSTQRG